MCVRHAVPACKWLVRGGWALSDKGVLWATARAVLTGNLLDQVGTCCGV